MNAATFGFIVYLGATTVLLLILSVKAYRISKWKNTASFIKAVQSMRSIYGTVLIHLYDTSTDIAILISWGILANQEVSGKENHENVNMLSFLIPSILLIFMYRVAYAIIHWTSFHGTVLSSTSTRDMILILFDLYIFVLVYDQFSLQYLSPCMMQQKLQLLESVFESMPQLVMQSIFLIRTYNTELANSENIYIVFASVIASLISIVTKFLHIDREWVTTRAASSHFTCKKCPCISISYLFVILWRFCQSIARFSIFTLLWAVVGGIYLPIYLLFSIVMYMCLEKYTDLVWIVVNKYSNKNKKYDVSFKIKFIWVLQSIVGIPLRKKMSMVIIRFVDNCIILAIIYSFAFSKFDCIFCYDKTERNALYNPYILILLVMAGSATILGFVIYLGLHLNDIIALDRTKLCVQIVGLDKLSEQDRDRAAIYPGLCRLAMMHKQISIQDNMQFAKHNVKNDEHDGLESPAKHESIMVEKIEFVDKPQKAVKNVLDQMRKASLSVEVYDKDTMGNLHQASIISMGQYDDP